MVVSRWAAVTATSGRWRRFSVAVRTRHGPCQAGAGASFSRKGDLATFNKIRQPIGGVGIMGLPAWARGLVRGLVRADDLRASLDRQSAREAGCWPIALWVLFFGQAMSFCFGLSIADWQRMVHHRVFLPCASNCKN